MIRKIVLLLMTVMMGVGLNARRVEAAPPPFLFIGPVTSVNIFGGDTICPAVSSISFTACADNPVDLIPSAPGLLMTGEFGMGTAAGGTGLPATFLYFGLLDSYAISGFAPFNPNAGTPGGIIIFNGSIWGNNVYLWVIISGAPIQPDPFDVDPAKDTLNLNGWHYVTTASGT